MTNFIYGALCLFMLMQLAAFFDPFLPLWLATLPWSAL